MAFVKLNNLVLVRYSELFKDDLDLAMMPLAVPSRTDIRHCKALLTKDLVQPNVHAK